MSSGGGALFPPPPEGYRPPTLSPSPPVGGSDSPSPKRSKSHSPPRAARSSGLFSCLRAGSGSAPPSDDDDDDDDNNDKAVWSDMSPSVNCPVIADFPSKMHAALNGASSINIGLLVANAELLANFRTFLGEEHAIENLDCWEELSRLRDVCAAGELATAKSRLLEIHSRFFSPDSPSQVGCSELYVPSASLVDSVDSLSAEELAQQTAYMLRTLETNSLRDPLVRWQIFQRRALGLNDHDDDDDDDDN